MLSPCSPYLSRKKPSPLKNLLFLLLIILLAEPPSLLARSIKLGSLAATPVDQNTTSTAPPPLKDLAAERTRITAHLNEASKQLQDTEQALATPEEHLQERDLQALRERINLLRNQVQVANRHLALIDEAPVIRDEKRQAQDDFTSWVGFSQPPPYPFSLAEKIALDLKALQITIVSDQTRLLATDHGNTLAGDELERSKKTFRQTLEAMEAAITDDEKVKARKQHGESQLTLEVSEEGLDFLRASKQLLEEKLGLNRLREDLLRKKLQTALETAFLSEEALQAKNHEVEKQLSTARTELEEVISSENALRGTLESLQASLDAIVKNKENKDPRQQLEFRLQQKELEIVLATIDDINLRISYLQTTQEYWRKFFDLQPKWDLAKVTLFSEDLATLLPIIEEGVHSLALTINEVDAFKVEQQYETTALNEPRQALSEALLSRGRQLHQNQQAAIAFLDTIRLWKQMMKTRIGTMNLTEQARGWNDVFNSYLQRIWSFEILSVDDSIVVDGVPTLEKRPVTVGKVLQAIGILILGLLVASLLSHLLSRIIFPFSASHHQRRLLFQKMLRVALIIGVVILALVTVRIPLTVFAFLGGAIAIGIGFGAQNLLNNFISGFILLGENQIRVGDRIEIEGNEGIVKRIGNRCTQVRRLDGVEILIPNSQLLERSVTNMTLSDRHIRKTIEIGVAYGAPTRQIHQLLLDIVRSHELVVVDPEPAVVFEDFGDNALIFCAYFWLDFASQKDFRAVISELRHTISERFAEQGFNIAYPQRDVHVDVASPIPVQLLPADSPD